MLCAPAMLASTEISPSLFREDNKKVAQEIEKVMILMFTKQLT